MTTYPPQTISLSSHNNVWTESFGTRIDQRRKHVEKAMAWWEDQKQVTTWICWGLLSFHFFFWIFAKCWNICCLTRKCSWQVGIAIVSVPERINANVNAGNRTVFLWLLHKALQSAQVMPVTSSWENDHLSFAQEEDLLWRSWRTKSSQSIWHRPNKVDHTNQNVHTSKGGSILYYWQNENWLIFC